VAIEDGLNDAALHAASAPVDQPHFPQPCLVGRAEILIHNRWNVAWVERVQVYGVFNGETVDHN
jgi:hypothetical protein